MNPSHPQARSFPALRADSQLRWLHRNSVMTATRPSLPADLLAAQKHDTRLRAAGPYSRRGAATTLFWTGDFQPDDLRLAVIGTRQITPSMTVLTERVVLAAKTKLAPHARLSILSGLALGCDAAAHRAALSSGVHTTAVVTHTLDPMQISPASNRGLAQQIARSGAIVSEDPDAPFSRAAYVLRDHVQAQLSAGTLAVATSVGGGTLNATRESLLLGRPTGLIIPPSRERQLEGYRGSAMITEALRSSNDRLLAQALGVGGKTDWLSTSAGQEHGALMAHQARQWLRPIGTKEALMDFLDETLQSYHAARQ